MPKDQLIQVRAPTDGIVGRRAFLLDAGRTAGGALLLVRTAGLTAFLSSCGNDDSVTPSTSDNGVIDGVIVDAAGSIQQSLGQVYLMYGSGLQTGRAAPVNAAGIFEFRDVPPGIW